DVGLLRHEAHRRAGTPPRLAGEGRVVAGHDAEQRALPHPVRPDDADLRAREEREVEVGDDPLVRGMDLRHPLHREDIVRHTRAVSGTPAVQSPAVTREAAGRLTPNARPAAGSLPRPAMGRTNYPSSSG